MRNAAAFVGAVALLSMVVLSPGSGAAQDAPVPASAIPSARSDSQSKPWRFISITSLVAGARAGRAPARVRSSGDPRWGLIQETDDPLEATIQTDQPEIGSFDEGLGFAGDHERPTEARPIVMRIRFPT